MPTSQAETSDLRERLAGTRPALRSQQLLRAATSVASNYRAACLARSPAEWLAKIGIVREESDEALFWLQFILRANPAGVDKASLKPLLDEADELTRIFAASYRTSKTQRDAPRLRRLGPG